MSINESDWDYEKERLKSVYKFINEQLKKKRQNIESYRSNIISARKSMWEEAPGAPTKFEEMVDVQHYLDGLKHEWEKYVFYSKLIERLEKVKKTPYFARIDFKENFVNTVEQIYIGISSLIDDETRHIHVYDWRAPISGMFYDYELGNAGYKCQDGFIEGEILLKRQFKISKSKIEYMFDSSIKIDDEVLQMILSRNADEKMKHIVTTIQKEQNRIIRDEENNLLVVQGPAGSGKTSVALHRIAYLLYKHRDSKINSNNILIFSPNQIFNDYISNVLPELGEENMKQSTFLEYAKDLIGNQFKLEDFNDQMEYILCGCNDRDYMTRIKGIGFKSDMRYLKLVNAYLEYIEDSGIKFNDVTYNGRVIVSKREIDDLFHKHYKSLPIAKRLDKIQDRVMDVVEKRKKKKMKEAEDEVVRTGEHKGNAQSAARVKLAKEFREVRESIAGMCSFDAYKAYIRLFEEPGLLLALLQRIESEDGNQDGIENSIEEIGAFTLNSLRRRSIYFEDLPAFLIIKTALEGTKNMTRIRHVVIDEGQDYSVLQYELIRRLFSSSDITILGDLNQSIHPHMNAGKYENILNIFDIQKSTLVHLNKSYRTTKEIFEFSYSVFSSDEGVEVVNRSGDKPCVVEMVSDEQLEKIIEDIENLKAKGMKSIALICKTEQQSRSLFNRVKQTIEVSLLTKEDDEFLSGTIVMPSYLAKGLEFDAVLIYDAGSRNYHLESERKLFYTICTRALHVLRLYYYKEPSPFLNSIDNGLYEVEKL